MNTIIEQQLELEFGDDYPNLKANTTSYVKGLIGKPWWLDRRSLIASEGPLENMVTDCLCRILEEGDRIRGFKAYTAYLSKFYGSGVKETPTDSELVEVWDKLCPVSFDDTRSEIFVGDLPEWISKDQAEFMEAYARMNLDEVADIYELTPRQVTYRKQTIKRSVRRRLDS